MPATAPKPPDPLEYAIQRAVILRNADADVVRILRAAQQDVINMLRELASRPAGIGRDVREAQLRLVQRNLHLEMAKVWRQLNKVAEVRRAEAAARSIDYTRSLNTFKLLTGGVPDGKQIADAIAESEAANAASGIDRLIARSSGASYVPLKDRVYNSQVNIGSQVDRMVNSALARGLSAAEFAKEVRGFINPATPGGIRYASMRLARTEINNAAHAMAVESVRDTPWVEVMEWRLSGSHGRPDVCDRLAKGGPNNDGVYPKRSVPSKPHPQCLCYVVATTVSDDEFEDNLLSGKYNQYLDKYRNIPPGTVVRSNFGGGFPSPPPATKAVKPTKTGTPAKPGAKPSTQAKPPTVFTPPTQTSAESVAKSLINAGKSSKEIHDTLTAMGLSPVQSAKTVSKVKKDIAGGAIGPVKQVTAPIGRSSAPAARVVPAPASVVAPEDLLRAKVRLSGSDKAQIETELLRQARLVPRTAQSLKGVDYASVAENVRWGADADALGYYIRQPGQERIFLNRQVFTDHYRLKTFQLEMHTNWCSKAGSGLGGDQAVFAHEFGHHVAEQIARLPFVERRDFFARVADALGVRPPASGAARDVGDWFRRSQTTVSNLVSKYGGTSVDEMLAEVWHEFSTNPNARKHIKVIGELMRDLGERGAAL